MLPGGAVSPDLCGDIARQLGTPPALSGQAVTVVPGGGLTADDMTALEGLLIGQHGAVCLEVVRAAALEAMATVRGGSTAPAVRPESSHATGRRPTEVAGDSLLVRRTLRSGQRVRFAGNVIVLGDVNPGAEIVAGGDIVVMGTLRGVAHAGASGDTDAIVAAFRLAPTQLRVGGVIGRAPDGGLERPEAPEVARVRDGILVLERLQQTFGELYSGAAGAMDGGGRA